MQRVFSLFLLPLCLWAAGGCRSESTPKTAAGTYRLKSALLNNNGRLLELTCAGEFELALSSGTNSVQVNSEGSALCNAANPASFVERLGGDCVLEKIHFPATGRGEIYATTGARLSCLEKEPLASSFTLQPLTDRTLLLKRLSSSSETTATEFLFELI